MKQCSCENMYHSVSVLYEGRLVPPTKETRGNLVWSLSGVTSVLVLRADNTTFVGFSASTGTETDISTS